MQDVLLLYAGEKQINEFPREYICVIRTYIAARRLSEPFEVQCLPKEK